MPSSIPGPVPPYGVAMQQAIATGNLAKMKELITQIKNLPEQKPEYESLLELLNQEILKHEPGSD